MPRDYKGRASSGGGGRRPAPCWAWFLGGLLVGLLAGVLAWLKYGGGASAPLARPPAAAQSREQKPAPVEPEAPRPQFEFYTTLPEMEVVVPEPEPAPPAPRGAEQTDAPPGGGVTAIAEDRYMLQMGSFRKYADADRLKASLALVGILAEIQRVNVNGSDTFHRVRSGPYSRDTVNSLRARLRENNISSLVIRLKQ
ncbi:MAG: SPOR domain-containing protein [Candidatus Sedimenticola endophacoides]